MSQPLIAGTISAPVLAIVGEPVYGHKGNELNVIYQSSRGKTPGRVGDDRLLKEHDNVVERMLLEDVSEMEKVEGLIETIKEGKRRRNTPPPCIRPSRGPGRIRRVNGT